MYIMVQDTDENRTPQISETVSVTVYVGNGTTEGVSATGLVLDTQTMDLSESADTSGIFRSAAVVVTDTVVPVVGDNRLSWGRSDTVHVAYTDPNTPSDTSRDTALSLEIATTSTAQWYEDAGFVDFVDTYIPRNERVHVEVIDTDENRNPQLRDTVSVTVYVGNGGGPVGGAVGLVLDTETLVLTESGETTSRFRSDTLAVTDTEYPIVSQNFRLTVGLSDTLHVSYTDVTGGSTDSAVDTALIVDSPTIGAITLYDDTGYLDPTDTYHVHDLVYIEVSDPDENRNPQVKDTILAVVAYIHDNIDGITDTETLVLTESGETTGIFRASNIMATDTVSPVAGDGILTEGQGDTLRVVYTDDNDATDVRTDTAKFEDHPRASSVTFYQDTGFTDNADTYLARNDVVRIEVVDYDQNISPIIKDTVTVSVWVGDNATGLVLDSEVFVLTESGETTEMYRSAAIALVDTEYPIVMGNGRLVAGLGDTLHVYYSDTNTASDTSFDTALI
ncbi:MAG: hypothetical protein AABX98_05870, partial [Nanoarchaeota archaeon]